MDKASFKKIFDHEVVKQMRDNKVPGMAVLITKGGEIFYERSFGTREWQGSKPTNSDTLFGIASMTKSITSLAILQLEEMGKLSIDDPISKYIPVNLDLEETAPIKIRHLMAHASGIPNLGSYGVQIKNENLTEFNTPNLPMGTWDDFYFHINDGKDWVISPPDTKFYYNNDAYTMLSRIISYVSGLEYEEYAKEHILNPLDMTRSTFSREEVEADENHAKGYSTEFKENGIKREPKSHLSGWFQSGAGGLNSTVKELTNYLRMLLDMGKFKGKQLISSDSIKQMQSPQNTNMTGDPIYLNETNMSYGFGLRISDFFGYTLIQHGGASGVSGGVVAIIPELDITYVHLYNVGWFSSHMLYIALFALIGKDPHKEFSYLVRREHFKKLTGKYFSYRKLLEIDINFQNGLLEISNEIIGENKTSLVQVDHTEDQPLEFWQYSPTGRSKIIFTITNNDKVYVEIERNLYKKSSYDDDLE